MSIFTIFYLFSRFKHYYRDLHFVAIYALFPQIFFGPNSLLRNITRFLHVCVENVCHQVIQQLKFLESEDEAVLEMVWEAGEEENKVVNTIIIVILRNMTKQSLKVMITLNNETKEATISADR